MLGCSTVPSTHTPPFIFMFLSINFCFGQLVGRRPNSPASGKVGRLPSALSRLRTPPLASSPDLSSALDQSLGLLSFCKGAEPCLLAGGAPRESIAPPLECQLIVATLSHLIKIQSLPPRLKLAFPLTDCHPGLKNSSSFVSIFTPSIQKRFTLWPIRT